MAATEWPTNSHDVEVLRRLAERKARIARDPSNLERRRLWYKHDARQGERPMVLAEAEAAFGDLPDSNLECREEWARQIERRLRYEIFEFESIKDDRVISPYIECNWHVHCSHFGVEPKIVWAERVSGNVSSRQWDPPIKDLDKDFGELRPRTYSVDRVTSLAWKAHLERVFDGAAPVRIRGGYWWSVGMTNTAIDLVGLENFLTFMCTNPDGIRRLMSFLRDEYIRYANWIEREGLLTLNNEHDYIGSGSVGYTRQLPKQALESGANSVRLKDLWVLSESQETSNISPEMFEDFVFRYQLPIIERFGLCYYGCCEPLHHKWPVIKRIPNLRRVSVAPWCDQEFMAEALGTNYVFSRKPNPTLVSTPNFDETAVREDIGHTLTVARGCTVELIMKDVHTLCGEPHRLSRWVQIAREVIDELYGR